MFKFLESANKNVNEFRLRHEKVFEMPFNSNHRYQLSIHETKDEDEEDHRLLVVMMGAPEKLVKCSSHILVDGENLELDNGWKKKIDNACKTLAKSGERVMAVCNMRLDSEEYPTNFKFRLNENGKPNVPLNKMKFLGLMSIIDPPRPGVGEAVQKCKLAGIRVVMITGDHFMTAKAIAKAVGIITMDTIEDYQENFHSNYGLIDKDAIKAAVITGN